MPSTPSKVSSGTKRAASAEKAPRSSKPSSLPPPPKSKVTPQGGGARPRRWSKESGATESADAAAAEALSAATAVTDAERSTRGGLTKAELKAQFAKLSAALSQIATLKRTLNKSFVDIGTLLNQIRSERLYEVKGYGSFESFVERELDLNKGTCLKLVRIAESLHRDQALAAGLDRCSAAVAALDGETEASQPSRPGGSPAGGVPLHKQ